MRKQPLTDEERRARRAESSRRWYAANKDKVRATKRAYYSTEAGKAQKRKEDAAFIASGGRAKVEEARKQRPLSDAGKAARAKWSAVNKDYWAANRAYRRGLERDLGEFDRFVLVEAVGLARLREQCVGGKWHVDHVVPVSKGGQSCANNLQVVPAAWNRRKSNVHTERFIGAEGGSHGSE